LQVAAVVVVILQVLLAQGVAEQGAIEQHQVLL
jgi:hypothetical protein